MDDRFHQAGCFRQILLVEARFKDRFDALVAVRFQKKGAAASGLHPLRRVSFFQPDDAQAGTKALLRVSATLHDAGHQSPGMGSVSTRPVPNPGGGPFQNVLMGLGHMFRKRGVRTFPITSRMTGDAAVLEQYLHRSCRQPHLHLLFAS